MVNVNGTLGNKIDADDLEGMREWLRASRPGGQG